MPEESQHGAPPPSIGSSQSPPPPSRQTSGFDISSLPDDLQTSVSNALSESLRPWGRWVTDGYISLDGHTENFFHEITRELSNPTTFSAVQEGFDKVDAGIKYALHTVCTAIATTYCMNWSEDELLKAVGTSYRLSWRIGLGYTCVMLLKGSGDEDGDEPGEILACGQGGDLEQDHATALHYMVESTKTNQEWKVDLSPLAGDLGWGLMRVGEEKFGRCQLESLVKLSHAPEWKGERAMRLGFAVTAP